MESKLIDGKPENRKCVSNEYLRGLVEGEGCFTLCTHGNIKIPTFVIQMHIRDKELINALCNRLRLSNEIYIIKPRNNDGWNRGFACRLMVRDCESLKDKVIPFFYNKLHGHKRFQFDAWLEKIGTDPAISKKSKEIFHLYKTGYYETYPKEKFWEKYDIVSEV